MTTSGIAGCVTGFRPLLPPPAGVRAVVFDVVGTLVEPHPSVAVAYQRAAARHGMERGVAEIDGLFRAAWRKQEAIDAAAATPFATDRARERDRWRAMAWKVPFQKGRDQPESSERRPVF